MLNRRSILLPSVAALLLSLLSASAQGPPASGLYQIVSGRSIACCGFAGFIIEELPSAGDAFIELTVDLGSNTARMKFLGQDARTVLTLPAQPSRSEFVYAFTNGAVFPNYIQFGDPLMPPLPGQVYFSFVVFNSNDTLSLNGTVIAPCPGSADLPEMFEHTNVVAVLAPLAAIRVSEVEVCWNSASNRTYQVQYRSATTTDTWVNLGAPVVGNGSTNCLSDPVPPAPSQRFYRVVLLP